MRKKFLGVVAILGLSAMIVGGMAQAATTADVTATVMVQNIAISLTTDGSINYGTLVAGGTQSTLPSSGVDDMQTVRNDGNVNEKFWIRGYDVSTGCTWTLAAAQGSEQYFHKFCNDTADDCSSPPTHYTALTTSYQVLATSVSTSGTVDVQFQIGVPSSTSCTSQATVQVTIMAEAAS